MAWPSTRGKTAFHMCSVACVTWPCPNLSSSMAACQLSIACISVVWYHLHDSSTQAAPLCTMHRANTRRESTSLQSSRGVKRPSERARRERETERAEKCIQGHTAWKQGNVGFLLVGVFMRSQQQELCHLMLQKVTSGSELCSGPFPLRQFESVPLPACLPCPTARVTVLLPWSVEKGTRTYVVIFLVQSPAFQFQTAHIQQAAAIAGDKPPTAH